MNVRPLIAVLAAAVLFGVSTPLAKLLLGEIPPVALAGLLYSGAFLGLGVYRGAAGCARRWSRSQRSAGEAPLDKRDLPGSPGLS